MADNPTETTTTTSSERKLTDDEVKALYEACINPVLALMQALVSSGLTRTQAAKAVRWAAHKIENAPDEPD